MYLKPEALDPQYRERLWRHVVQLLALESGADVGVNDVIAAVVFLQAHLSMLLETTPVMEPPQD